MLTSTFDENHLHELVKQRWRVIKVGEQLLRNSIEVRHGELVQQNSYLADHFIEFVLFC